MYQRNLGSIIPRGGLNVINAGTSGLIFSTPFGSLDVMGPGPVPGGTLDKIKKRGHLNCGITRRAGFGVFNTEKLKWEGFDVDYCKALSAAIFDGAAHHVVYHVLPATERFVVQAMGKVDVLSRITTYNFERDVSEPTSMTGFSFSQPVFYDGLSFGGLPGFAECADALDTTTGICVDLKICVNDGTTTVKRTRELFPEDNIVVKPTGEEALAGLVSGECNAVAGGSHDLARASVESVGYTGNYAIGVNRFSKDPLALVTNQDDPEWTDFVYWVVTSTFFAEEQGITKDLAGSKMPTTNLFGPLYTRMFINAVQAVGNHGEIYTRNVEPLVPRGGLNALNSGGAQIYPLPGIPLAL
ncbi:Putative amino-acid ABC transporter-binding protein YhdW [Seminavis robusta]|uniref:Amino-acid ABC transporter-binding protein YhdW n=1 Tax=Seminavis robusta TaxID=568900 RepID=A0A9N8EFT0_9STRA|nr:Putative amino-acid ABC transporter-binding protein YhdW [Seminavis robusta]|eukprot:Sro1130_g244570.1 Putative amino-acid ABC transporter-binding protein YhdW (356) ;mRNA; r:35406-36473